MATYQTELEALNALYDIVSAVSSNVASIKTQTDDIKTSLTNANTKLDTVSTSIGTTNSTLAQTNIKLDSSNNLQTAANAIMTEIQGEVVDVRNIPTDTCIIRVYVGDVTKKREGAAREVARLLGEGYRPYMIMGISEDLARVLFVKYPNPNESKTPNAA